MTRAAAPAAALAALLAVAASLQLSRDYAHGPFPFDDNAQLYFTVDLSTRTAFMAVVVADPAIVAAGANWLGLGVGEPESGSMLGADVVTAEFGPDDTDRCVFTDRHVPFAAYPLIESVGSARSAFPDPDDCQDDGSWTLVRCARSVSDGEMILEVARPLDAHDSQDRDIVPGLNNIIYAYGAFFAYHGSRRASTRVLMYQEDGDETIVGQAQPDLPDDVDGSILVQATNYLIPDQQVTTYACTSHRVKLEKGEKRMIVAAEPILNATDVNKVHHLTLFLCSGEEYADKIKDTIECTTADNGIPGPLGSAETKCSTFIYAYAKGMKRLVLPREAGILMDDRDYILVMETHYDNPDLVSGELDASGVRVHYTNTMRDNEAASLLMGDSLVSLFGERVQNNFEYEFTCPSECTSKFARPINVFASFLHMHTTGKEIYNNKFSENGTFIENMNKVNFWSDSFQNYIVFDPPKQVRPGEQMQVSCLYDTTKRPDTVFGAETLDEMCMDFVGYWPVQRDPVTGDRINLCAFGRDNGNTFTFCGDSGNLSLSSTVLPVQNPKFEDTIGAPTDFGEGDTCDVPDLSPTPLATESSSPGDSPRLEESPAASPASAAATPNGDANGPTSENDPEASADEDENTCFPASATVTIQDGAVKRMDELQVGDMVQVAHGAFSEVFMFTHKSVDEQYAFVELTTEGGPSVTVTGGHYIYINGGLAMARTARAGDALTLGDGSQARVSSARWVWETGLFNPQTVHGDIVVDGVVASTYTRSVEPRAAHGLLAPLRWAFYVCGVDSSILVS